MYHVLGDLLSILYSLRVNVSCIEFKCDAETAIKAKDWFENTFAEKWIQTEKHYFDSQEDWEEWKNYEAEEYYSSYEEFESSRTPMKSSFSENGFSAVFESLAMDVTDGATLYDEKDVLIDTLRQFRKEYLNVSFEGYIGYLSVDEHGSDLTEFGVSSESNKIWFDEFPDNSRYSSIGRGLAKAVVKDEFWDNLFENYITEVKEEDKYDNYYEQLDTSLSMADLLQILVMYSEWLPDHVLEKAISKAEEHAVGSREKLEELFSEVCDFLNKNSNPSSDDASSTAIRDIKAQWKCKTLDDGTLKLLSYKGNQTEIHIPSVIGRKTVTAIDATALRDDAPRITAAQKSIRENITLIEVPGSIKMIPDGFLYRKAERESSGRYRLKESKLSSVILNEGIEEIGKDAFGNCSGIGEIVIPDSVKSIGDGAFSGCIKLEKIVLPATVHKYPDYLFQNTGLKEFTIPNHVSRIGRAVFSGCVNLEKVTLSKKLKTISESLFSACKSLKTVEITAGVREIEADAFSYSGIEYCRIPSTVKKIGRHVFFSCEKLRAIEISDTTEVAEDCFQGCSNLTFNNCEQSYDKRIVVFRGTLQSYGNAFWQDFAYCVEPLALPQNVERISSRLWTGLPDIIYHPFIGMPSDERKKFNGISAGDELLFGRFPQTSDCELMPLSWNVLCVKKGRALLITNKAIISVYSDCFVRDMRSWEHSKIREWLNTCFLSVAFSEAEQKTIVPVINTSFVDLGSKQEDGQDTKDAVFLLSFDEAKEFMKSDQDWRSEPTEYALMHHNCNGRWGCDAYWPTRTAGIKEGTGPVSILYNGSRINDESQSCSYVLRPAIWVRVEQEGMGKG